MKDPLKYFSKNGMRETNQTIIDLPAQLVSLLIAHVEVQSLDFL